MTTAQVLELPLNSPHMIRIVTASARRHPGQWTILALQTDTNLGGPYLGAGLDVYYRNEHVRGTADILLRWPASETPQR